MKIYLLAASLLFGFVCSGQTTRKEAREISKGILPDEAFDRMIIQDITYAIFGETNPVSGVKADVSKPEATISGVFSLKKGGSILLGMDFKGGITDKNFSIFKGTNTFNTAFEIRPALHIIPARSYANYNSEISIIKAKVELVDSKSNSQKDTFEVARIIYNHHLSNFPEVKDPPNDSSNPNLNETQKAILAHLTNKLIGSNLLQFDVDDQFRQLVVEFIGFIDSVNISDAERATLNSIATLLQPTQQTKIIVGSDFPKTFDAFVTVSYSESFTPRQRRVLQALIQRLEKRDKFRYTTDDSISTILGGIAVAGKTDENINIATYNDGIVDLYQKQKDKQLDSNSKLDQQIKVASPAWTSKQYFWWTISTFARTEKLNLYQTMYGDKDSTYFKQDYPFFYGVGIAYNVLRIHPHKLAQYWKIGINASHSNNITTLSSFNYETRSDLFGYGTSKTEKVKIGTAYNASEVKSDFLFQVGAEYYVLPINTVFPGLYLSANINISSLYRLQNIAGRTTDNTQVPLEAGLVFNINNRDKDKSLLSISLYGRFEDATDRRRTSIEDGKRESRDDFQKRNLGFGIKVGIPITLPKRN